MPVQRSFTKALRAVVTALLFPAVLLAFSPAAIAQTPTSVTLRLAWIPGLGGDQPAYFLGVEKGFYKQAGIDLRLVEGKGAAPNSTLLAQKSEEFSVIDANVLALGVGQGLPIRSVGTFVQQAPFDLVFSTSSGIKTVADLKGKTVGLQSGEAMTDLFNRLLVVNNVDPKSVRVVSITGANKPQVLYQGQVDAVGAYVTGDFYRVKLGAPPGFTVDHLLYKDLGVTTLNASIAAHTDLIRDNPGLIKRFMTATVRAWEYARKNPAEAVEATLKANPKSNKQFVTDTLDWALKLAQTSRSAGRPLGWTSETDWTETLDLLEKYVGLKNRQPSARYFTNEFISNP